MDLLISNGKVVELAKDIQPCPDTEVINLENKVVAPVLLISMFVCGNLVLNTKKLFYRLSCCYPWGFTGIACMPNTNPPADNEGVIELILARAKKYGLADVYPIACITKGQEGKELTEFAI